ADAHGPLRPLAGSGVGARPLAPDRQTPPVPETPIRADIDKALDVQLNFAPQVSFDDVVLVDRFPEAGDLIFGEIAHARVRVHLSHLQELLCPRTTDAVDVGEGDFNPLLPRQVDPCDSSQCRPPPVYP